MTARETARPDAVDAASYASGTGSRGESWLEVSAVRDGVSA
jgi:hypothetical protein